MPLRAGAGVHLRHTIYSSTENATNKKLIEIIKYFFFYSIDTIQIHLYKYIS